MYKRYFGVEIETSANLTSSTIAWAIKQVTSRKIMQSGWRPTYDNNYWHIKTDVTCKDKNSNWGWEIVSFKASGMSDLTEIGHVADSLSVAGLVANTNCGLHVHVDIGDFSPSEVGVLCARWIKIEEIFTHMLPRRRLGNVFCKLLRKNKKINLEHKYKSLDLWETIRPIDYSLTNNPQKWTALNLVNYADFLNSQKYGSNRQRHRSTVEFRLPEGTVWSMDIVAWIMLFVNFVEESKRCRMPRSLDSVNLYNFSKYFGLHRKIDLHDIIFLKAFIFNRICTYGRGDFAKIGAKFLYKLYKEKSKYKDLNKWIQSTYLNVIN